MKMMTSLKKVYERPSVEIIPAADEHVLATVSGVRYGQEDDDNPTPIETDPEDPYKNDDFAKGFGFDEYDNSWDVSW